MRCATLICLLLGLAPHVYAAERIADGVELISGEFTPGHQPDGNSVLFETSSGLIVMDSGRHAAHTRKILDAAQASGKPIVAVVNSHWHLDHIGGNPRIRAAYPQVRIYASAALFDAQKGFLANYRQQLEGALADSKDSAQQDSYRDEIALIDAGPQLAPDEIVEHSRSLRIGARRLDLHLEKHSVTAGDIWVFDPATRVLAAGDLVTLPVPFFDTACPARWSIALATLDRVNFSRLVPGHGAPMTHAQFASYRGAFDHLRACAASDATKARCTDVWLQDAASLLSEQERASVPMLLEYYIDNSLRADAHQVAALCATQIAPRSSP